MKVSGKLLYKSAIVVNDVFFKDIDELLSEYFERPNYSARLINGDEVEFEFLSELISYDNFSDRGIKTMKIGFGIGNYIRIEPSITLINGYKSTLEMRFEVDNNDRSEEIKRKVNLICEKHKQSLLYTMASKFSFMHVCFLLMFTSFILNVRELISPIGDFVEMSESREVAIATVVSVVLLAICVTLLWVIKRFFPAIVFDLGENMKSVEKKSKTKSNIFWCIIVAGIVSALVSSFFN